MEEITKMEPMGGEELIDYAAGKIAFELCNHPEYMTQEGDAMAYGVNLEEPGYLGIHHPAHITLDLLPELGRQTEAAAKSTVGVKQVSVKFMDPKDPLNKSPKDGQQYAFRLLSSVDGERWQVLYDSTATDNPYRVGWQHFVFRSAATSEAPQSETLQMRYFRIHALHNPITSGFQVVRLRLFNVENNDMPQGEKIVLPIDGSCDVEIGETTPLATKLLNISERLYRGVTKKFAEQTTVSEEEKSNFEVVYNHVVEKAFELQAVDGKVDQVRKVITPLISKKLEDKKVRSIASTRREWIVSLGLLVLYIIVSAIKAFQSTKM